MTAKTVSILYNTSVYVVKFRLPLIRALQQAGYEVVVIAPTDEATPVLLETGARHIPIGMSQYGMNPLAELKSIREITAILRRLRPCASLHYTVKPNTFGAIAAERAGVPVISNIAGAGRAFSSGNPVMRRLVSGLYRRGLRKVHTVFFQNGDDMEVFLRGGLVRQEQCKRIPGSGVDLQTYHAAPLPEGPARFLFVGRLLHEKGIAEYLQAAEQVLAETPAGARPEFHIVGEHEDTGKYIPRADLDRLTKTGQVTYHGTLKPAQVAEEIRCATCVVLPSYYGEGVPRVLLEACASARPIITTDNVGCRDVAEPGQNGWMVPPRDAASLAGAMREFLALPHARIEDMAQAARHTAETRFDEKIVLRAYLDSISEIATPSMPR